MSNNPEESGGPGIRQRIRLTRPTVCDILKQAKRDFVGKDVQQNTTYTYVWSADQGGHFMLGFVPCFLVYWVAQLLQIQCGLASPFASAHGLIYAAFAVMFVWSCLELYDLYDSRRIAKLGSQYFNFNFGNVVWNVVTALFFFALGAAVAALSAISPACVLSAILVLFTFQFFVMAIPWLRTKIFFQQAGLPYLYRLANFNGTFDTTHHTKDQIVAFVNQMRATPSDPDGTDVEGTLRPRRHLIITGSLSSGKSSLAAGIGTEFAFSGGIGRYTTMSELVQVIQVGQPHELKANQRALPKPDEQEFNDGRILWQWPSVDLLIVDDIVELILPMRRMFESKVRNGSFTKEVQMRFGNDNDLQKLLPDPHTREQVVQEVASKIQAELEHIAKPETFMDYIIREYHPVIEILRKIPRIIWVVGDTIKGDLFENFIRTQFNFTGVNASNLFKLELSSKNDDKS